MKTYLSGPARAAVLLFGSALFALSAAASGPTFHVNSGADAPDGNAGDGKCETAPSNGICTLRAAIMEANKTTEATIVIPALQITLTLGPRQPNGPEESGDLDIKTSMSIVGAGSGQSIVSANGVDEVFSVSGDGTIVSISGLTIRDGVPRGLLLNSGTLTVDRCAFVHNGPFGSEEGGGIEVTGGSLTVTNSEFTDCHASTGGAIWTDNGIHITNSTFTTNSANAAGGGAVNLAAGTGTIIGSTFSGNSAVSDGGAIWTGVPLDVLSSTFSGNSAGGSGGGIHDAGSAPVRLYNVTITGNQADADFNGTGAGGGVADGGVPGVSFVNSIIAGNFESFYLLSQYIQADGDCAGFLTSGGFNILGFHGAGCAVTGLFTQADPKLGPLQSNGGHGMTRALLSGSPAIDAGNPSGCADPLGALLPMDQRGALRLVGGRCDIGAYERGPCGDANGDGTVDVADVFFVINYLFSGGTAPAGLANVNGDGTVDVSDVFHMINTLFSGGPAADCSGA
jgi:CSLREA domain-containing protein